MQLPSLSLVSLLACHFALSAACGDSSYRPARVGDECGAFEAVCSDDGAALLVCTDAAFAEELACADGCVPDSAPVCVGGSCVTSACCDNGAERVCIEIHNSEARETFTDTP